MDIQIVEFNSDLHKKSIELRTKVLRTPLGLHFTKEELNAEKEEVHIVVLFQNEVIGVAVLKWLNHSTLKMRQVAIDDAFQKNGIGAQLIHFVESFAKANHCKKITLHARDTAKAFYLREGYHIEGNAFFEIGILHYEMGKNF